MNRVSLAAPAAHVESDFCSRCALCGAKAAPPADILLHDVQRLSPENGPGVEWGYDANGWLVVAYEQHDAGGVEYCPAHHERICLRDAFGQFGLVLPKVLR